MPSATLVLSQRYKMLRSDWHILACERVSVAPTKKQRHGNSCAPRALERYGAASPKVDYQLFAGSKNTPELRGRRAPQVRNGRTGLTKGMRHGRAKFLQDFAILFMKTGSAVTSGLRMSGGPRRFTKNPSEGC